MDMSAMIEADSTQVNADDFTASPRVVTITGVSKGTAEQPVNFDLAEFPGRVYRPGKSMRRIMVAIWGPDASAYVGRRLKLYNDQSIKFGPQVTGGIRIAAMSHLDKRVTVPLTVTRGRRAPFTVDPLVDEPSTSITDDEAADFARDIAESSTVVELEAVAAALKSCDLGKHRKRLQDAWSARKAEMAQEGE
jgi:hypothetical protein